MDKKRIIIFALAGIAVIFLFLILGSLGKQMSTLKQEKNKLEEANNVLNAKIESTLQLSRQLQERIAALSKDLEKINAEKQNIQQKYDLLFKEREDLKNEIKKLNDALTQKENALATISASSSQMQADAYWAGILKEKMSLELELSNLRNELNTLKLNNEQLQQGRRDNDLDLDLLSRDNRDFKRELEYNKKLLDSLTQELSREKTDKYQISEDLKAVKDENRFLRQQLKTTNERKILVETKLADLQSRNAALENSLAKMETFIRDKIMQMDSLREELGFLEKPSLETKGRTQVSGESGRQEKGGESVELQPIIVRPQEAKPKREISAQKGNILAVNKESNFVIINLGENAEIKPGDSFRVYNAKEEIAGTIVVVEVRKEISACDINQENFSLKVGDTVRQIPDF